MACCGDRRRSLIHAPQRPAPARPPAPKTPSAASQQPQAHAVMKPAGTMLIRYVGVSRTVVLGAASRRYYAFAPGGPAQTVDVRDAAMILRSVGFQRA
jgi:hypothetical protein